MPQDPIRSRRNPRVKALQALREAGGRVAAGCYLVEGWRSVEAALDAAAPLREAWLSPRLERAPRATELRRRLQEQPGVSLVEATDEVLAAAASTRSHQGILATCALPEEGPLPRAQPGRDLLVLADLQDPGNAGTIWRSAAATGAVALLQGEAGVDPYGPKVVRAAAGAAFQVPARRLPVTVQLLDQLKALGYQVVGTASAGAARYDRAPWGPSVALLVGQEGPGLPEELLAACDMSVRIPMAPGVESLNAGVSTSVLLFELARSRDFSTLDGPNGVPGLGPGG